MSDHGEENGYVERGIKFASPETIETLSKVLKVTPDKLFKSDAKDAAPNAKRKREALHALGSLLSQESPEYIRMVARMVEALRKRGK